MINLGAHVSIAGNIYESLDRAKCLGLTTMQIFSSNPRSWRVDKWQQSSIEEFKKRRVLYKINPVVVHIPYLANLASPQKDIFTKSKTSFLDNLRNADAINADYFVTHLGSHKGLGIEQGIKRFSEGLESILKSSMAGSMILLENTAGAGNSIGFRFEHIKKIIENLKGYSGRIGVCLDIAHTFASGYDIKTKKGLEDTLIQFDGLIGIDKLKVIHLNDSKGSLGSMVDRHENIGLGEIGKEGFKNILHNKYLKDLPFILETPVRKKGDDRRNIRVVKKLWL